MINSKPYLENAHATSDLSKEPHRGLSSVFAAAVVNQSFREMLLRDPEAALEHGYLGRGFSLSPKEISLILSINASSLAELATQIMLFSQK